MSTDPEELKQEIGELKLKLSVANETVARLARRLLDDAWEMAAPEGEVVLVTINGGSKTPRVASFNVKSVSQASKWVFEEFERRQF